MISTDEVKNLANLSRIELSDAEIEKFKGEIGSILDYVAKIQSVVVSTTNTTNTTNAASSVYPKSTNVLRDDTNPNEGGVYTEALVSSAPNRDQNYVQVKHMF